MQLGLNAILCIPIKYDIVKLVYTKQYLDNATRCTIVCNYPHYYIFSYCCCSIFSCGLSPDDDENDVAEVDPVLVDLISIDIGYDEFTMMVGSFAVKGKL